MYTSYKRKNTSSYNSKKLSKFIDKYFYSITIAFIILCITWGIWILIRKEFFSKDDIITNIVFEKKNDSIYETKEIYKKISDSLIWKNFYFTKIFEISNIESDIKTKFPILKKISISKIKDNTIKIEINYEEPIFIIEIGWSFFWIRDNNYYSLQSWIQDLLPSNILKISLPQYKNKKNLSGIFLNFSTTNLQEILNEIINRIPSYKKITYIPWAKRISIKNENNTEIVFNLTKDIWEQLKKLETFKKNYLDFTKAKEIDLSSLEYIILNK